MPKTGAVITIIVFIFVYKHKVNNMRSNDKACVHEARFTKLH